MDTASPKSAKFNGDGIIIFQTVADAMKGEKAARAAGYEMKLVAPPPQLRMGCDLALEINLVEKQGIERLYRGNDVSYLEFLPLTSDSPALCAVVKVTDFGQWYMVKAGNMKLSFEKKSGRVVNVSGGGCPDIPYLNAEMSDKTLRETPQPRDLGFTLCATMLQRAYEEAVRLFEGGSVS